MLKALDSRGSAAPPNPGAVLPFLRSLTAMARMGWNPYFADPKLQERLYRVTCPTLVIWGSEDRFIPPTAAKAYAEGISDVRLVELAGCGHLPPLEQPERWAEEVVGFLRS
jgi:pimeloyl-ACP methyl ester carboxylesterase